MHINNDPSWLEVNCVGESTGAKYHGKFLVKPYLTLAERANAERYADKLMHDLPRDSIIRTIMATLATLKSHFVEVDATWWVKDGTELHDEAPVAELVKLVSELQRPKTPEEKPAQDVK